MNDQRDIGRVLDHWFSDGPTVVSDRVIDGVADRIERQSQRHALRLRWRPVEIRLATLAASVATIVIVVTLGFIVLSRGGGVGPPVAPTPSPTHGSTSPRPTIRVGSDDAYESRLVAELYAQALERAGYPVVRHPGLGTPADRALAFMSGQVDLVPVQVGRELAGYDATKVGSDASANGSALAYQYQLRSDLAFILSESPGEDPDEAVVRRETADTLGLTTMSDLATVQDRLRWGLPPDCAINPLCKGALERYGIRYPPTQTQALASCDTPLADALRDSVVDIAWMCSTQRAIAQFGFVVLVDDKETQPPANFAPIVRNDYLARYPILADRDAFLFVIDSVSARLTTDELDKLGIAVDGSNADVAAVAAGWLTDQGLPR